MSGDRQIEDGGRVDDDVVTPAGKIESRFRLRIGRLGRSDVWRWTSVERWARNTRRLSPAE
jgi:hypothetical protein